MDQENHLGYDENNGLYVSPSGERYALAPWDLLAAFNQVLASAAEHVPGHVLYVAGKAYAARLLEELAQDCLPEYGKGLEDVTVAEYVRLVQEKCRTLGLGYPEFDFALTPAGVVEAAWMNGEVLTRTLGTGQPAGSFVAGLLAGLIEPFAGQALDCLEYASAVRGDPSNGFLITVGARLQQGFELAAQGQSASVVRAAIAG
ncbi:MAG: hypothetical protein GMKNLPBB_03049 [Myxococcota bacterium]|nr:hypothetical protein [Myxococcota bacterium]